MIVILAIMILYFAFIIMLTDYDPGLITIVLIVLWIIGSFSSLTVMIDGNNLRIKFGYGIYRKNFKLHEITSAKTVKNHWYYGWGIRIWFWPRMVIYNVSGFDAVEIKLKNGKTYRIGTDEPEALEIAILHAIQKQDKLTSNH